MRIADEVMRKLALLVAKEASLRGSADPHSRYEAEAFAEAIQRLLLQHNLSMSEVEAVLNAERNPIGHELFYPGMVDVQDQRRRVHWQEELAAIVAQAHLCSLLCVPGTNAVYFVGRPTERALAAYAYGMLLRFADAYSRTDEAAQQVRAPAEVGLKGYRNSWLRGFNLRIAERYRALERRAVLEATLALPAGERSALALVRRLDQARADAQDWVAENVDTADALRPETATRLDGLMDGYHRGGEPALGRTGVEGAHETPALPA